MTRFPSTLSWPRWGSPLSCSESPRSGLRAHRFRSCARLNWRPGDRAPSTVALGRALVVCKHASLPIRPRVAEDLASCVALARVVHELDGYPVYLPSDLGNFLAPPDAVGAWVAEREGIIIGHVALHSRSSDAVMTLASQALGHPPDRLGVVARLLVSPERRRGGTGRSLLDVATRDALARGLSPILDVVSRHRAAIALYESCGWTRAGRVIASWRDDEEIEEFVYLGPPWT